MSLPRAASKRDTAEMARMSSGGGARSNPLAEVRLVFPLHPACFLTPLFATCMAALIGWGTGGAGLALGMPWLAQVAGCSSTVAGSSPSHTIASAPICLPLQPWQLLVESGRDRPPSPALGKLAVEGERVALATMVRPAQLGCSV